MTSSPTATVAVLPASAGMVRVSPGSGTCSERAPRQRGDGPSMTSSPTATVAVLPASAGMVRGDSRDPPRHRCAPRQRGDGPSGRARRRPRRTCSPPARGWSWSPCRRHETPTVLPASAGMVRGRRPAAPDRASAPRQRGDGPAGPSHKGAASPCSPPARGWSVGVVYSAGCGVVLPASAGMVRGPRRLNQATLVCSPPARGWSAPGRPTRTQCGVLPASAGMVPVAVKRCPLTRSAPRQRGDGPKVVGRGGECVSVLPASAGMVPCRFFQKRPGPSAPRQRGDGPFGRLWRRVSRSCSPPARGWSHDFYATPGPVSVLPASAGMVRIGMVARRGRVGAPRQRGDGPIVDDDLHLTPTCSPPARGWSCAHGIQP